MTLMLTASFDIQFRLLCGAISANTLSACILVTTSYIFRARVVLMHKEWMATNQASVTLASLSRS